MTRCETSRYTTDVGDGGECDEKGTERGRARVAREIEVLEAARHPGVVEVVGVEEGPDGPRLETTAGDGVPLARLAPLTTEEVAGTVAAVASTLADLHDLGLVHGALSAECILVRSDGRPVLFGFGHGGRAGETAGDGPLDPADDVFGLGVVLKELVDRPTGGPDVADGHRPRTAGRGTDSLRAVADRATVADRHLRLSARALAAAVGHAVPTACLPRRPEPDIAGDDGGDQGVEVPVAVTDPLLALRRRGTDRSPGSRIGRPPWGASGRRRLVIGAGGVVVAGVVGSMALGATSSSTNTAPSAPGLRPPGVTSSRPPATTVPRPTASAPVTTAVTSPAGRSCPPVAAALTADTNGDGCPEGLRWVDGVVEGPNGRWAVGRPGDQVATGDWSCAGMRTLALLRPGTGEVFVFGGWAGAEGELAATARAVVDGGFALRSGDLDADGCTDLLVDRSGREAVHVPTAVDD